MIQEHNKLYEDNDEAQAASIWKQKFEEEYAEKFDRAIVTCKVCGIRFGPDKRECQCVIDWDHKFDTRDETLKKEFHAEVDEVITQVMREYRQQMIKARQEEL